jgi:hypothetical protein
MSPLPGKVLFAFAIVRLATAHTWIEQLAVIAHNRSFVGDYGYSRSFVDRGLPAFSQDANLWLVPPLEQQPPFVTEQNILCHPSQRIPMQMPGYPRLQATPGSPIAMRYAENGHATIPGGGGGLLGKPAKGGTVFVFGTHDPHPNEMLMDVLNWNSNGTGGDRRGRLLTAQDFDDGRCYQLGNGAVLANQRQLITPNSVPGQPGSEHEVMCETDVQLPNSVEVDRLYTLYWIWQWPTAAKKDPGLPNGRDEYYVSCTDIEVVLNLRSTPAQHVLIQQDTLSAAVLNFESRLASTGDPLALYSTTTVVYEPVKLTNSSVYIASPAPASETSKPTTTVVYNPAPEPTSDAPTSTGAAPSPSVTPSNDGYMGRL